ncbi:sugar phosphate isomerase/epimerase [Actinomadura luteofluorescens]|uniref:Sugar phosphate isomerase/epimerase n=1 Tax=Actinomadura luteofluorescens TaxID=46163 RepID=A0A7Y9EPS0_9ACTN|nr:sugar phosphate isomerase/epimerase family protein [Actinomadura luteofluorescens]NYD51662.1 sugar phosphate isomerase/epimerase [Actinomadura luteofluorescens]
MIDLAFSTLGVPGMPLPEVLGLAAREGYTGLELRCADGEAVRPDMPSPERRRAATACREAGVTPLCLASYIKIAAPGSDRPVLDDLRRHLELAADLGSPFLRVFPGGLDRPAAARRLNQVDADARDNGVRVLVETHDSHPRGRDVAALIADAPGAGAIWDVLHPRLAGEPPRATHAALADRLAYVQFKDVSPSRAPVPLGGGVLPLDEIGEVLARGRYRGWVSWEYEAAWFPEAAPLPTLLAAGRKWFSRLGTRP